MRSVYYILFLAFTAAIVSPLNARDDWSDLHPEPQTYYGSEKAKKVPVDAIFWVQEDWEGHYSNQLFWIYEYTEYPRFVSTRFFPFYYSLDSKIDERESVFVMPFPGLFYHRRFDSDETRINSTFWFSRDNRNTNKIWDLYFFLFYSSEEGPSADRDYDHAFFPLYFGGSNPSRGQSYSTLLPLYFFESETSKDRDYLALILPLFFYEGSDTRRGTDSTHFSPLHYHSEDRSRSSDGSEIYSVSTGFPILPVLYSTKKTESTSDTNYLTVFHVTRDEDSSSYVSPFYLWENHPDYSVRWLPLYFEDTREDGYFHLPPLWFSDQEPEGDTNFSVLHYYSKDGDSSIFGFPIIPLIYASRSEPDYSRHNLLTIFYWDSSPDSSTTFIPPYYHSREKRRSSALKTGSAISQRTELPPFRSINRPTGSPIYGSGDPESEEYVDHYNLAFLIDWKETGDSMDRFFFLPLYYQGFANPSNGQESYAYLFPLYFQNSSPESFNTWGPLHYYDRTEQEKSFLLPLLPVLYAYRTDGKTTKRNYLTFFYTRDSEDGYLRFLPPYYHSHDIESASTGIVRKDHYNIALLANWNERNDELLDFFFAPIYFWKEGEEGYTHVVPIYFEDRSPERELNFGPLHYFRKDQDTEYLWVLPYYSWINNTESGSSGNVMIPLYFNYEDPVKNYHVNLGGISLSEESLDVRVNTVTGETKAVSVLDTDIGWFYNLFSYSARIPLQETDDTRVRRPDTVQDIPEGTQILSVDTLDPDQVGTEQPELIEEESGVAIKKDTSINRENSIRFSGWSVLFGLFARETADTRHHARALPLFWLSWDDASADQVTVIPGAYMSYDEEPEHYFVLFPLFIPVYASQETPDYSLHSYGLFLYLDEEDRVANRTETSIIWPFYNSYDSPDESGSRLLPVYYSKRDKYEDGKSYSEYSLTPLSYSSESKSYAEGSGALERESSAFISPLYLSSSLNYRKYSESWTFLPVPLYYSGVEGNQKSQNLLLLAHRNSTVEEDGSTTTQSARLFPIVFYGQNYHSVFPLYYYESDGPGDNSFLSPIYWSDSRAGKTDHRFLWIISWQSGDTARGDANLFPIFFYEENDHLVVFPLYFGFGPTGSRTHWGPLYYYDRTDTSIDFLAGLFYYSNYEYSGGDDSSFHVLPLVYNWWEGDTYTGFYGIFYYTSSPSYSKQYIPLIYENEWERANNDRRSVSFLLQSMYYESDDRETHFGLLYRILMGYKSGTENSRSSNSHWNFNLTSFVIASGADSYHNSFLPIYWYGSDSSSNTFHFIPLLTFNHWDSSGYTGLHGPLYVEKDNTGYSRYFAIAPFIYDSEWQTESSGEEFGETSFLLKSMYYENRRNYSQTGLLWRALGGYRSDKNSDYWNANFLTFVMAGQSDGWHHSFLPLYYMDREGNNLDVWIPPLLGWSHSTSSEVSEGLGLGLLWYRSRDDNRQEHYRSILMGGLLYYDRYKGAQNGFREWGSLYGFLWDYEIEPSSGYEKFSILKFIFSRTKNEGKTTYRFLFVPIEFQN
ncbi:MAG: hypothetical protein CMF59_09510 [Leptospiraceae bacterium]|nr:hypothetical protein [Leptospiraceae bacterium]